MSNQIELAKAYYAKVDSGDASVVDLFTDDVELYFPKYGIVRGKNAFLDLAANLGKVVQQITHHKDEFNIFEDHNHVIVEGTTFGVGTNGRSWKGGETPGGHFCSVFRFNDTEQGMKIGRMYIYLDPDYTNENQADFPVESQFDSLST